MLRLPLLLLPLLLPLTPLTLSGEAPLLLLLLRLLLAVLLLLSGWLLLSLLLLLLLPAPGMGAGIARIIGAEATGYRTTLHAAAAMPPTATNVEPGSSKYGQ